MHAQTLLQEDSHHSLLLQAMPCKTPSWYCLSFTCQLSFVKHAQITGSFWEITSGFISKTGLNMMLDQVVTVKRKLHPELDEFPLCRKMTAAIGFGKNATVKIVFLKFSSKPGLPKRVKVQTRRVTRQVVDVVWSSSTSSFQGGNATKTPGNLNGRWTLKRLQWAQAVKNSKLFPECRPQSTKNLWYIWPKKPVFTRNLCFLATFLMDRLVIYLSIYWCKLEFSGLLLFL